MFPIQFFQRYTINPWHNARRSRVATNYTTIKTRRNQLSITRRNSVYVIKSNQDDVHSRSTRRHHANQPQQFSAMAYVAYIPPNPPVRKEKQNWRRSRSRGAKSSASNGLKKKHVTLSMKNFEPKHETNDHGIIYLTQKAGETWVATLFLAIKCFALHYKSNGWPIINHRSNGWMDPPTISSAMNPPPNYDNLCT